MMLDITPETMMVLIAIGAFLGYLTARWLLRDKSNNPPKDQESYYEWVMKRREEARREHEDKKRR